MPRPLVLLAALSLAACDPGRIGIDDDTPGDGSDDTGGDGSGDTADTSDTGQPADSDPGDTDDTAPPATPTVADLAATGPYTVQTSTGSQAVSEGCGSVLGSGSLDYFHASPDAGRASSLVVVLTHGFGRARANMNGWARHLASHGFHAYSVDLCSNFLLIDHEKNGRALAQFANARFLGNDVVFVGYSAGGLAAVLAAKDADGAVGVFGLDMVDSNGTGGGPIPPSNDPNFGATAAPDLDVPFWGIKGTPSSCNADGNGVAVYEAAPDGVVLELMDAGHCDFERPKNQGSLPCTFGCPDPTPSALTDREQQDLLAAMLTSFVQWRAGVGNQPGAFWTEGLEPHDSLTDTDGPLIP